MRVGVLTGGGDCPGLNAVIRAIVRDSERRGSRVVGIREGWRGLVEADTRSLSRDDVSGMIREGGTMLLTSRTNPFRAPKTLERLLENWERLALDALIAIGGEDTLGVAARLHSEYGWPVVGVPKTIDNDVACTELTFGFDTAVSIATEAIDRLQTTAGSHQRLMVVEVMGRHTGWIATWAGLAGGADVICIPERPTSVDEICERLEQRRRAGRGFAILVVAEGAHIRGLGEARSARTDEFGHELLGGVGHELARTVERRTGVEARVTVLGHIQRGGTPTAFDRVLATRYGVYASGLVHEAAFGQMAALKAGTIVSVSLEEAVAETKAVPLELYELSEVFFG
ncbi:MAG: 6-phosphofructokinase [Myxococcales bacterium]|nr:6-phosphofructokinase [Myxococcales bacterium]